MILEKTLISKDECHYNIKYPDEEGWLIYDSKTLLSLLDKEARDMQQLLQIEKEIFAYWMGDYPWETEEYLSRIHGSIDSHWIPTQNNSVLFIYSEDKSKLTNDISAFLKNEVQMTGICTWIADKHSDQFPPGCKWIDNIRLNDLRKMNSEEVSKIMQTFEEELVLPFTQRKLFAYDRAIEICYSTNPKVSHTVRIGSHSNIDNYNKMNLILANKVVPQIQANFQFIHGMEPKDTRALAPCIRDALKMTIYFREKGHFALFQPTSPFSNHPIWEEKTKRAYYVGFI